MTSKRSKDYFKFSAANFFFVSFEETYRSSTYLRLGLLQLLTRLRTRAAISSAITLRRRPSGGLDRRRLLFFVLSSACARVFQPHFLSAPLVSGRFPFFLSFLFYCFFFFVFFSRCGVCGRGEREEERKRAAAVGSS